MSEPDHNFIEFLKEITEPGLSGFVHYYKLDKNRTVVPASDMLDWALFFEKQDRRIVKQECIAEYWVSTVFLGIDHGFNRSGAPVLFETMVFVDKEEDADSGESKARQRESTGGCERYCTWDEAAAGHEAVCARLREHG